jgi:hypothetical protein
MIPPDVASSLRLILPDQQAATNAATQPVVAAQKIADVLSNLIPGQRVLAEIQALLPNGNYRAIVGQRDLTLALPFAAKAGDSIELEVTESDGKLTLAFVANRTSTSAANANPESVPTTFSSTGKLIGNLMAAIDGEGKRAPATPLNGNQALVENMPKNAADLVPVLKQAITQSGMFYEAHQARWVAGQLPTEALRQEPQARFSPTPLPVTVNGAFDPKISGASASLPAEQAAQILQSTLLSNKGAGSAESLVQLRLNSAYNNLGSGGDLEIGLPPASNSASASSPQQLDAIDKSKISNLPTATTSTNVTENAKPEASTPTAQTNQRTEQVASNTQPGNPIPRDLTPIVQQQLDGLANQNFAWQGQVWPGQQMQWEIGENLANPRGENGEAVQWQTRLKLSLPMLGGIDAILQLRPDGEIGIKISADSEATTTRLRNSMNELREQFESAGLNLTQLSMQHGQPAE